MKKWVLLLAMAVCLAGCAGQTGELEQGMALRSKVLQAEKCTFSAKITGDYGDKVCVFAMDCVAEETGDVTFTVTAPETISGITGTLTGNGGSLTFEDTALHFGLLAEGLASPISAPWVLMQALRSGPIIAAGTEDDRLRLTLTDSYRDTALQLDVWCNGDALPVAVEIAQDDRTILSLVVDNFTILSQNAPSSHNVA